MKKLWSIFLLAICLSCSSAFARDLKEGVSGEDVKQWQRFLNTRNFELPVNGKFGPATKRATIIFQKKWGLYPDGVVGPRTSEKAKSLGYNSGKSGSLPRSQATTIVPGKSVGQISLKESRASVIKKLGPPTQSFRWESISIRQDTWINAKSKSRLIVLYPNSPDEVIQVETTSPAFSTTEGFSVRSSLIDIESLMLNGGKVFPLRSTKNAENYAMVQNAQRGIAFFLKGTARNGKFEKVIVFHPGVPIALFSPNVYKFAPHNR